MRAIVVEPDDRDLRRAVAHDSGEVKVGLRLVA